MHEKFVNKTKKNEVTNRRKSQARGWKLENGKWKNEEEGGSGEPRGLNNKQVTSRGATM